MLRQHLLGYYQKRHHEVSLITKKKAATEGAQLVS